LFGGTPIVPPVEIQTEVRKGISSALREVLQRFNAEGEVAVVDGAPAPAILNYAEQIGASVIVVGTHGRTGLARVALGSVAERVVRAAPCSVLVERLRA
jgi:nucleotide-binding universal stress UspA family protein